METRNIREKYPNISKEWNEWAEKAGMEMLLLWIVSWNIEDDDGKTLEITEENLDKLPQNDLLFLMQEITWVESKKK